MVLASAVPTTVPASSGAFREVHRVGAVLRGQECHAPRPPRRLVLVPQSVNATPQSIQDRQWERDAGVESHNRFSPLQDTVIDALEADLIPVPASVLSPVPQSERCLLSGKEVQSSCAGGVDGDTPSSSDVVGDIRRVPLSGFA